MAFSSGTKTALGEAVSWAIAGVIVAASFFYYDELKAIFTPVIEQQLSTSTTPGKPPQRQQSVSAQAASNDGYVVKLKAGPYGHYKTVARVNGREVDVLVDTGASFVALTHEDAERAGIYVNSSDYTHRTRTANGETRVAMVDIGRMSIGDIEVRNVRATVHERGSLHVTLLGMSFLSKLRRAEMRRGELVLEN